MSLRRIFAVIVLALDACVVLRVAPGMGMLGPVFQLVGALVGICALGVLVFDLPLAKRHRAGRQYRRSEVSHGESMLLQRAGGLLGILLLVVAPLVIAVRGVYLGVLPPFLRPRGPEVSLSQAPGLFALNLLAYVVLGCAFLFLMMRGRRANSKSPGGIEVVSRDRKG